jgi:hypothetical protein
VAGQAGWKPNPPNRALMTFWESWRINKPAPILPRDFQRRLGNPPAFAEGPGRSSASANRVAEQRSSGSFLSRCRFFLAAVNNKSGPIFTESTTNKIRRESSSCCILCPT